MTKAISKMTYEEAVNYVNRPVAVFFPSKKRLWYFAILTHVSKGFMEYANGAFVGNPEGFSIRVERLYKDAETKAFAKRHLMDAWGAPWKKCDHIVVWLPQVEDVMAAIPNITV